MNKIIFSILALTTLPICAMDVPQNTINNEELPLWQFKRVVELWPTFAAKELSDSEKRGILSELRLPQLEEEIRNYRGYETAFYSYIIDEIGSAFNNIQRADLRILRTKLDSLQEEVEQECRKQLGDPLAAATDAHYQEALRIALGYQPRILELLKDIRNPYETSETADASSK